MPLVSKSFSDIITFSRGSNATMFDSSGTLVYAPNNAIRNNTMVGAVAGTPGTLPTNWTVFTNVTGLTRQIVGTGTENGITYIEIKLSGTPSGSGVYQLQFEPSNTVAAVTAQTWTQSAYLKLQAGSYTGVSSSRFGFSEYTSGGGFVTFNTVVVSSATGAALSTQRFTGTQTLNGGATTAFLLPFFELALSGAAIDITLRIGMPQLEIGPVATAVNATSGTAYYGPRLDYDPATLAARGLLIEEQRTNLATYSAAFNDPAGWIAQSGLSVTANAIVAPDGTLTAERLFSNGTQVGYLDKNISVTSGVTYNFSCFFKKNNTSTVTMLLYGAHFNSGGGNVIGDFNLDTGVATGINGTASITAVGNGWYRCVLTKAATTTGATTQQSIRMANATGDVYAWGYQIEEGAFPTSYIPTTTTALTRSADAASVDTLSPWFNAAASTLYGEWTNIAATMPTGANQNVVRIGDTTGNNLISLFQIQGAGTKASQNMLSGGVNPGRLDAGGTYSNATVKAAAAFAPSDRALAVNGGAAVTSAVGAMPLAQTRMGVGMDDGFFNLINGHLRRITYYPRRLSNAELQAITA